MNDFQRLILKHQAMDSRLTPEKCELTVLSHFKNADNTGDDDPKVGSFWKEFWQIFTQEDFPKTCPFCGKPLAAEDVSGCHINIRRVRLYPKEGEDRYYYTSKRYIIPGHQGCNKCSEDENEFQSKIEVTAVEAIKK